MTFGTFALSYAFTGPLNTGLLGLGTNNSLVAFTSYVVQKLPVSFTYSALQDFSGTVANPFVAQTGTWNATTGTTGRYAAFPPSGDAAVATRRFSVEPLSYVEYSATVNAAKSGTTAGLTFAQTSSNDFLYAGIVAGSNQVVLGHRSNGVWTVDATASVTIAVGTDYTLLVALVEGTTNTVNVVLNGKSVTSFSYNLLVHDGNVGLFARGGNASFDNVLLRGDDVAYSGGGAPLMAAAAAMQQAMNVGTLDTAAVGAAIAEAERRWVASGLVDAEAVAALGPIQIQIADLPGLELGLAVETQNELVIDVNAAGHGWFIDPTLTCDNEFSQRINGDERAATPGSAAYGRIDLLTVVEHEIGHLLGFEHGSIDVMGGLLAAGVRITPQAMPMVAAAVDLPRVFFAPSFDSAGAGFAAAPQAAAPRIDWSPARARGPAVLTAPTADKAGWQRDFVNHLGQTETQRNPNLGFRLHLPVTSRATVR